jgi:retron-type reverse transcriptase
MFSIVTQDGLSKQMHTSRGIKQGCPVSPIVFAILMSALERRLLRLFPTLGVQLHEHRTILSSYADDIKLFGTNE